MKILNFIFIVTATLTVSLLMSCGSVTEKTLELDLANTGILVTDITGDTYNTIKDLDDFYDYNGKYISILLKENDSLFKMPEIKNDKENINKIIELSNLMRKVYREYNILADKAFTIEDTDLSGKIIAATELLTSLDSTFKKQTDDIKSSVDSHKYDVKTAMYSLISVVNDFIEKDIKIREWYVNEVFTQYRKGLEAVPTSAFDPIKIAGMINEPVRGDEILIEVYKLQLIDNAKKRQNELEQRLSEVKISYEILEAAQAELIKKVVSKEQLQKHIKEIERMFGTN